MKKFLLILPILSVVFASCNLHDLDEPDFGEQVYVEEVLGKWSLSNDRYYKTLELTSAGYYYAIESGTDWELVYGKFQKTDSMQFTLYGLGVMDVTSVGDDYLKFYLTVEGDDELVTQAAAKADVISEGDDTDDICTQWKINEFGPTTGSGSTDDDDVTTEPTVYTDIQYVVFTDTGTLVLIDNDGKAALGQWEWTAPSASSDDEGYRIINYKYSSDETWNKSGDAVVEVNTLSSEYMSIYYTLTTRELDDEGEVIESSITETEYFAVLESSKIEIE